MRLKSLITKVTGVLTSMALVVGFTLPVFAQERGVTGYAGSTRYSGYVYIQSSSAGAVLEANSDADLAVLGRAFDENGESNGFSGSCTEGRYASGHVTGQYTYAYSDFVVSSDDGYDKVYVNMTLDR